MTASEGSAVDIRIRSVRQVRRVANGAPFVPHGLLPVLGLATLLLFGLSAFANGVESTASLAAHEALDRTGAMWARVSVSGQWAQVSGEPPSQAEADEVINAIKNASVGTLFGKARPVTMVSQVFTALPVKPAASAQPAPATPTSDATATSTAQAPALDPSPACDRAFADLLGAKNIQFAPASADIDAEDGPFLDALARVAQTCPGVFSIQGYTDNSGTDTLNEELSRERAEAVRKALIERGMSAERIVAEGRGASDPVASNLTEAGRDRNRRIEILVQDPGTSN